MVLSYSDLPSSILIHQDKDDPCVNLVEENQHFRGLVRERVWAKCNNTRGEERVRQQRHRWKLRAGESGLEERQIIGLGGRRQPGRV